MHALGLTDGAGADLTESFYWDLERPDPRLHEARMRPQIGNSALRMIHAGGYAAVVHYLKAVADMGVAAAKASGVEAVARMKAMPRR